ncbi:MAG: Gfo/Idh/MocA family oxidoreductase [Clostridia bacterium]|nr:Gfo/Idh/MocA family oxidoreductase [Clostridia bacterium]
MAGVVRYGLIGCGGIAHTHAAAIGQMENARLAACCDQQMEKADSFAKQYGCKAYADYVQMLHDPEVDAVCICTPCSSHGQMIREAADSGKHILCEKPVMLDVAALKALIVHCENRGVQFTGVMQHRYDPPAEALRRAIEKGHFGKILLGGVRILWYRDEAYYASSPWRGQKKDGGSVLANQGIHYLDLLLSLMGDCCVISACGRTLGRHDSHADNYVSAQLQFGNGAIGNLECTTAAYPGIYAELSVFGQEGSAVIRNDRLVFYAHKGPSDSVLSSLLCESANSVSTSSADLDFAGHLRQYRDFTNALLHHCALRYTALDALKTLQVIGQIEEACIQSGTFTRRPDSPRFP